MFKIWKVKVRFYNRLNCYATLKTTVVASNPDDACCAGIDAVKAIDSANSIIEIFVRIRGE